MVAVLDTGVLYDHPDLGRGDRGGKLLPGFDFVTGIAQANDEVGRDADPSDPGDWITSTDQYESRPVRLRRFRQQLARNARRRNDRRAHQQHRRASPDFPGIPSSCRCACLGKCGGTDSDIIAGMRWAAGLHVDGVTDNPTPARILNLSLGATSPCEPSYLDVIQELTTRKVLVVISAGNEGTVVSSPGNCPGVAAIAAIRHAGSKVGFSNLGPEVDHRRARAAIASTSMAAPACSRWTRPRTTARPAPATHTYTDQIEQQPRHQLLGADRFGHRRPDALAKQQLIDVADAGAAA